MTAWTREHEARRRDAAEPKPSPDKPGMYRFAIADYRDIAVALAEIRRQSAEIEALRRALEQAIDVAEDGILYATTYFVEKHGMAERLEECKRALSAAPSREQEHGAQAPGATTDEGSQEPIAAASSVGQPASVGGSTATTPKPGAGVHCGASAGDAQARHLHTPPSERRAEGRWIVPVLECSVCHEQFIGEEPRADHERACWRAEPERGADERDTFDSTAVPFAARADIGAYERGYRAGWTAASEVLP